MDWDAAVYHRVSDPQLAWGRGVRCIDLPDGKRLRVQCETDGRGERCLVAPGQTLEVTAEIIKQDETLTTLKAQATVNGNVAVTGRLVLERFNLADRYPLRKETDPYLRNEMRERLTELMSAGNAAASEARSGFNTPRSVMRPVTRRAGVTSKA